MLADAFSQEMLLFTIPALAGAAVFVLRMSMMALGGFTEGLETDGDLDLDADGAGDAGDSTEAFRALSVQSIAAFAMGFGAGGLVGRLGLEWSTTASVVAGLLFGSALLWLLGLIMKAVHDLQCHGNIDIRTAVGLEGTVEFLVPAAGNGRGRVRLVIDERLRSYEAVSDGDALFSQTRVRVLRVNDDNTLTVTAVA